MNERERMTTELVSPAEPREIWIAYLVPVFLALALNTALVYALPKTQANPSQWLVREKWKLLDRQTRPVDWLVLGDSSGNQGVDAGVLAERMGGTVLNLCTVADLLVMSDAWMLETYVHKVGAPKALVLVHVYDVWARELEPRAISAIPRSIEAIEELRPSPELSWTERWEIALARYLPLYTQDQTLARAVQYPWRLRGRRWTLDELGYMAMADPQPANVTRDAKEHLERLPSAATELSAENRRALEAIADLARRYGFPVYLAPSPIFSDLHADPRFRAHFDKLRGTLDAALLELPPIRRLGEPMAFPVGQLQNVDHVTAEGAREFTESLASRLKYVVQ